MNGAGAAVATYAFRSGPHRGSQLTLHATCLVHRHAEATETVPLAGVAAIRVAFERDPGRIGWGLAAVAVAAVLYAIAEPLASVADTAAADLAGGGSGVAAGLHALFRMIAAAARLLPFLALAGALGGAALVALGWLGRTVLGLVLAGTEREYAVRGRDAALVDFAEATAQALMQLTRG